MQISCAEQHLHRWWRQLVVSCTCGDMVKSRQNGHQLVVSSGQENISIMKNHVLNNSCSGSVWSSISSSSTESLSSTSEEFWSKYERGYKTRSFWKKVRKVILQSKKIKQEHHNELVSLDEFFNSLHTSYTIPLNEEYGTIFKEDFFDFPPPLPNRMNEMKPPARPPVNYYVNV
jgi:hypothetical protein